ncbi:proline dehydrogenase transcriptional activator [Rhodobacter veldkampii DSM 11550]|uniref:Proline dehydrogenase transcriptional activator n=1 Tax=Phaeovulum veldkampii DSM 11550 TaxID=1185920 RepID=A0A2T4JNL9_9RHOB|nr:Lrp/AsnC ligand binding domain-containing protein [Phaeovulum veldkampii]MBK5944892.1 proline dehydrogenase transcriptional activator [Phaeovulum veldkampii DSM 11550]NCU21382.1 winged helix-turn-helix transcriptional regulator [Candidatus Falkowbacteria bacterium]PTE19357.1 proline dehydrogenase transcriptional activator [Phaeovulum veldkampii DSM 11550]TDQ62202.1 AsnC family transcriptional regulator [Phaeovulum veldkampii DSM 11550]
MANDLFALDRFDRAILAALAADGRISIADLARRVGLTKTPVQARMKRLEQAGVIAGYRAVLNPIRMGLAHVAFVEVRLSDTREVALQAFNRAVRAVPEIEECHMIAGGFDYLLKVRTGDIADYRRVMAERISTLPHVAATSTYVAMEAVKESGPVSWP